MHRRSIDLPGETLPPGVARKPFSDAVLVGDTLYVSGRIGLDPATGVPPADPADEAAALMENLRGVLDAAGFSLRELVAVTVFSPDLAAYGVFNEVYLSYFSGDLPARAYVGSGPLLFGARYELTAVAVRAG
ncbi:MAG TPA: Rid family hydrolase [Verrucomicrobiae bacterium]|nr:Rid family hydrolase [Verrucomicrobiae bacterium]